jgi:hypothetical protein
MTRVLVWCASIAGAAAILIGTSAAADLFHPLPQPPSPPGKDEMAIGTYQCSQQAGDSQGFSFLSFTGTAAIGSPSLQAQFSNAAGSQTPVTCPGLVQQVANDAAAKGCSVGPVADVGSSGEPETTVHFVCSGGHDAVVDAIAAVSRSLAAATLAGGID